MDDHIRQFDWFTSQADTCFVTEKEVQDCVIERILSNRFHEPPWVPSDSEEEIEKPKYTFNWDRIFTRKNEKHARYKHIPGSHPAPPYPKLSAIPGQQHYQCLKVLSFKNPNVLEGEVMYRPTKADWKIFEELQEAYTKEQVEFKEWAKQLWITSHCRRALRPTLPIETVYKAEFKMRESEMQSFPKIYQMAAQIPLEAKNNICEMICKKDLKSVNVSDLPQIEYPDLTKERVTILKPCTFPQPCDKHPCRFILPNESTVSILPLTEIHRELSQWAHDSGAGFVASESALKCLIELEQAWMLPISVCSAVSADGDKSNVVVLGSNFAVNKESAPSRTYRAFRHLVEHAFVPLEHRAKLEQRLQKQRESGLSGGPRPAPRERADSGSSDDGDLVIDIGSINKNDTEMDEEEENKEEEEKENTSANNQKSTSEHDEIEENRQNESAIGVYTCTCKDEMYSQPPPRSFTKWLVINKTTGDEHTLITHCSHKTKYNLEEVLLEPIPEYQIDLAGSEHSEQKLRSIALSLLLRRNAALVNVRIDSLSGDIVTLDTLSMNDFTKKYGDLIPEVANRVSTALDQLQGLRPGNYILKHEPNHGVNALLFAPGAGPSETLKLEFNFCQLAEPDESRTVKTPPNLAPVLLPYHKARKILPLAFTPYEQQLAKETPQNKQLTRQKTPPQALKWPKKRSRKKN